MKTGVDRLFPPCLTFHHRGDEGVVRDDLSSRHIVADQRESASSLKILEDGSSERGADDHHAFHEDAKPGDLTAQFGTRRFSSSKKLMTVGVAVPFLLCTPLVVVIVLAKVGLLQVPPPP